jgi:internalin A
MKTRTIVLSLLLGLGPLGALPQLGCDEHKYDNEIAEAAAAASASAAAAASAKAAMAALASAVASAAPAPTWTRKNAADCKPHPATIDFTDQPGLEKEVRKKASKDTGPITPADLAQIKSINVTSAKIHQIDPCIFPMFSSLKGCFLGAGDYDDLTPLQKLTGLQDLNVSTSQVKDLHAIEGLKQLDRLDLSHTLVGDEQLKSVASLVNLTELTLDETGITDITPLSALTKLTLLSIKKTNVSSLAPIAGIKTLKKLYIAGSNVTDITPVQAATASGLKIFSQ